MKYVAHNETGKVFYFYESASPISSAPDGLILLEIPSHFNGDCADSHKVVDGQLVPIE